MRSVRRHAKFTVPCGGGAVGCLECGVASPWVPVISAVGMMKG